ncbi:MAG: immunoglobulin domain-containing protein [Holophagaceae bacterium]|nr:immunoglobulin domain-containing protein [Holophagaceae bacterium]
MDSVHGRPDYPADNSNYYLVTPIIAAPPGADPTGTVFYTYGGTTNRRVYRTTGGANWTNLRRLANGTAVAAVSHGIGAHPTDGNRLATASNSGIVYITTDAFASAPLPSNLNTLVPASGGRTWQGNNSNVAWVDNNILFAASVSTAPNSIHVARTTDGGATWAAAETGLPDLPVVKIVVDPGDPNTLYAATWLGVYRTIDSGTNWSLFGSGLPQGLVTDLYVHPNGNFLRAAVFGRGVWQVGGVPAYVAPAFSVQPVGASFTPPAGFILTGTVSNTYPTVTYQWQLNGVDLVDGGAISGATTPTLTVSSTACGSGGTYTLKASNCAGTTVSNAAIMTSTVAAPVITTQPANTEYATGNSFSLQVVASGAGLSYQWARNGTNLVNGAQPTWVVAGATTATLSITNAQAGTAGTYTCKVTGGSGCTVTSNNAIVISQTTAGLVAPNICTSPVNLTVAAPASASFTVTAGGGRVDAIGRVFTFQWRRNGVNLTNVAPYTNAVFSPASSTTNTVSATLTINPTSAALSGSVYDCVVTTTSGGSVPVTSGSATLTVLNQYTPATAVSITPSASLPISKSGGSWPLSFTAAGSGSVLQGTATPSPAGAYQYQFWVYVDDSLGWVMMQDYGVSATYNLPSTWQPGTYGIGVDCRTSSTVPYDVFNSIDFFTITPMRGPGDPLEPILQQPRSRPRFNGGAVFVTKN